MADIYCPVCGEPWDMDELHEVVTERNPSIRWREQPTGSYEKAYDEVRVDFHKKGCVVFGTKHNEMDGDLLPGYKENAKFRAMATDALMEISGDDLDGVASELQDYFGGGF